MKTIFTFLALAISFTISAQNINIPDANFKAYLVGNPLINTNGDGEIQLSEATNFTGEINCYDRAISDLTGIETFTKIKKLDCEINKLAFLDISKNIELESLDCSNNKLTSLDVTKNVNLKILDAYDNKLTSLDVSKNILLQELYLMENKLSELNLDNNVNLKLLDVIGNYSLRILKLQNNIKLQKLYCSNCQLFELDLRSNTDLNNILCGANDLFSLLLNNGQNSKITGFDSTNNPNLNCIQVDDVVYSTTNWPDKDSWAIYSTNCSLGVNETKKTSIQIYPNPVKEKFIINTNEKIEIVEIYSQTGQLLKTAKSKEINISNFPKGNYILKVKTDKDNITQKIIKE